MTRTAPPEPRAQLPEEPETNEKYLTLLEHLKELRYRVMMSALAVVAGLAVSFMFADEFLEYLKRPAEARIENFQLIFTQPFENFVTYFRVSLLGGVALAMPVIVYHALRFVTPGLKPNEKRWLYATAAGSALLFLSGVAFAYYVALPPALDFLLNFQQGLAQPMIRIGSYVDFVTRLLFWTGAAFQTPLIVLFLARMGIVSAGQLIRWWRFAVIIAFAVSAIVTPTIDPVTQSFVAGPIILLYFLGAGLAAIVRARR
jgi:sec-independent protein translocase protein TatC